MGGNINEAEKSIYNGAIEALSKIGNTTVRAVTDVIKEVIAGIKK